MVHTLIDKLIKGAKKTILIALTSSVIGSSGCVNQIPNRLPYVTEFNVSPTSGNVPLEVGIQFDGEDPDGKDDIIEYKLTIDREGTSNDEVITKSTPINISRTFNEEEDMKLYGQITDEAGATAETNTIEVKVFPNSKPEVDLRSILDSEKNFNEEEQIIINLPIPQDPDLEDNSVPYTTYTNIESLDGKVTSTLEGDTLNGYQLIITGNKDKIGNYQIELEFGSDKEGKNTATLEGIITNLVDIRGTLEDNVTDTGKQGIVEAYLPDGITLLEQTTTDNLGNFYLSFDKQYFEILLKARMMQDGKQASFIRTVRIGEEIPEDPLLHYYSITKTIPFIGQDLNDILLRVSPYTQILAEGVTPEQYKEHMRENVFNGYPSQGLTKFDWEDFKGIEIEMVNWLGEGYGTFSPELQKHYEKKLLDETDLGAYFHKRQIIIQLDNENSERHYVRSGYDAETGRAMISAHNGWIVIIPNNLAGIYTALTSAHDSDNDWMIDRAEIYMQDKGDATFTKEISRAIFGNMSKTIDTTLTANQTVFVYSSTLPAPSSIDNRSSYDTDEPNYEPKEDIDNILGL